MIGCRGERLSMAAFLMARCRRGRINSGERGTKPVLELTSYRASGTVAMFFLGGATMKVEASDLLRKIREVKERIRFDQRHNARNEKLRRLSYRLATFIQTVEFSQGMGQSAFGQECRLVKDIRNAVAEVEKLLSVGVPSVESNGELRA